MKTLLLIDENNLLFRMLDFGKGLSFAGKHTGGLYGFVQLFCKYVSAHTPDGVIVCADKPPYKRKEMYSGYKADRLNNPDPSRSAYIKESKILIREFLHHLNVPMWEEPGYESDDLIALSITKYKETFEEIIICSNDDDLYQLLDINVKLQKSKQLYTIDDFFQEFPDISHPMLWFFIQAMCGNHNGVKPLYKGLGIKTAIKISKDTEKSKEIVSKYADRWLENINLVHIPVDEEVIDNVPFILDSHSFSLKRVEKFLMQECGIRITKPMDESFLILGGR